MPSIMREGTLVGNKPFDVLLGNEVFVGLMPCLGELFDVHT